MLLIQIVHDNAVQVAISMVGDMTGIDWLDTLSADRDEEPASEQQSGGPSTTHKRRRGGEERPETLRRTPKRVRASPTASDRQSPAPRRNRAGRLA